MTNRLPLNAQDRLALHTLDPDFTVDTSGEVASVVGTMKIEIIRPADDRLRMTIRFPSDEQFIVNMSRSKTLEELGVIGGDNTRGTS